MQVSSLTNACVKLQRLFCGCHTVAWCLFFCALGLHVCSGELVSLLLATMLHYILCLKFRHFEQSKVQSRFRVVCAFVVSRDRHVLTCDLSCANVFTHPARTRTSTLDRYLNTLRLDWTEAGLMPEAARP